jgi:hypothetical protein
MHSLFKNASGIALWAFLLVTLSSCSKDEGVAGGVTDIGNSIASGIVVTETNVPAAHARVVVYYDDWDKTSIEDSVEAFADENGHFRLSYDSSRAAVLFAENENGAAGLSRMNNDDAFIMVGHPRRLESSIASVNSGYMRIVGSNEMVAVNADGSFAFDAIPVGDISLVYVAGEQSQARFNFMTTVVSDTLKIPALEKLEKNVDWLTISDFRYYSGAAFGGIMVSVPDNIVVPEKAVIMKDSLASDSTVKDTVAKDTATLDTVDKQPAILMELHLDGDAKVYNNDGSLADSVDYVEGISGKGIKLQVGQYINVGEIDPCVGDFTLSAWTKWNGFRGDGIYQVLFSERNLWTDGTSRFQLIYDFTMSSFVALSDGVDQAGYSWLCMGSIDRGGVMPKGSWAHLALVYENGKFYFYVNGELASVKDGVPFTPKDLPSPAPFRIGGTETANDTWNGVIDEVRIESVAHNADWVKAEYEKFAK